MAEAAWINADGGAPEYSAVELRRLQVMCLWPGVSDRMGARQGVRPTGQDVVSVSGTTWTQHDLTAVVYPGLTSTSGPYIVEKVEESGSLDPADGSNDRIDGLDLLVEDDDEDASGNRQVTVVYVTGTPAGSPSAPAVTTNALRLATILVPAGGSPSPSVDSLADYAVAAGGVLPVRDGESFPTSGVHEGAYADRDEGLWRRTGSDWQAVASPNAPEAVIFESSGNFVKGDYPWAHRVRVRGQGPGGGGGGAAQAADHGNSGGGGGGGYFEIWLDVGALSSSETVTIGSAGGGGSAGDNAGSGGGSVSFGSHATANGGNGGDGSAAGDALSAGGTGGTASGGDINIRGGDGMNGRVLDGVGLRLNMGGSAVLGPVAGLGVGGNAAGREGRGYGGGGSGANASTSDQPGGDGAPGVIIVEVH